MDLTELLKKHLFTSSQSFSPDHFQLTLHIFLNLQMAQAQLWLLMIFYPRQSHF